MVLTAEAIKASTDIMGLLLAKDLKGSATTEILMTQAIIPLSIKAQSRPYLAWRTILKTVTGLTPLNVTLIHPRRALLYWDVTDTTRKGKILRALDSAGFFRFPGEEGAVSDHHILRAYKNGYFKLLRQAALSGRTPQSIEWILSKAEEYWRQSTDKVRRHIWLRRIAWDRKALAEGTVVAAGVEPNLDPNGKPAGYMRPQDMTPRVSCQKWVCDFVYLLRDQQEARSRQAAEGPATQGGMDMGAA